MKKLISALLSAVLLISAAVLPVSALGNKFSESYIKGKYYDALLRTVLTSSGRDNMLTVALSQTGYHEGNNVGDLNGENEEGINGFAEYNFFCGPSDTGGYAYHWSGTFLSWCAAQAGISPDVVPICTRVPPMIDWFDAKGQYHRASDGYIPQKSDIIFVNTDYGYRAGLVRYTAGNMVYVIDGCLNGKVCLTSYPLSSDSILGYGAPAYTNNASAQSRYKVTADSLRVRSGPGTDYDKVGNVYAGNIITVESISGDWAKMSFNELSGWVSCDWIEAYTSGHTHRYTDTVIPPSGCTEGGCTLHECACGYGYTDAFIPAAGHRYVDYVTASGCTSEGNTCHVCSACGYSYTDGYAEALGHQWGEWYESDGTLRRDCRVCSSYEMKGNAGVTEVMTLSLPEVSAYVGSTVKVPVSAVGGPGVWGMVFKVEYDSSVLSFVEAEAGDMFTDGEIICEDRGGVCSVEVMNGAFSDEVGGTVAVLSFRVISSGTSALTLTFDPDNVINAAGENVSTVASGGSVEGKALLLGDVNLDGRISNMDIILLKRAVLKLLTLPVTEAADIDINNRINNFDYLLLKRILLRKIPYMYLTSVKSQ